MRLNLLPSTYAVCRLAANAAVPEWPSGEFVSVTRTANELSIVCEERFVPDDVKAERGWRCFALEGPIPFDTLGVAAAMTSALAAARISVFFVSTYDTDYVLVSEGSVDSSVAALREAGFDL